MVNRDDLRKNDLKLVLVRIDFNSIISLEDFIRQEEDFLNQNFEKYEIITLNKIDIEIANHKNIIEELKIPVKDISQEEIHRFTKNKFGEDILTFDIGKFFMTLKIDCTKYEKIDKYLDFFNETVKKLKKSDKFLFIKRIGIRKISEKICDSIEEISKVIKSDRINISNGIRNIKDNKLEIFNSNNHDLLFIDNILIHYKRIFQKGTKLVDNEEQEAFRIVLDFDGFINEEITNDKLMGFMEKINNLLFGLYIDTITEDYKNELRR